MRSWMAKKLYTHTDHKSIAGSHDGPRKDKACKFKSQVANDASYKDCWSEEQESPVDLAKATCLGQSLVRTICRASMLLVG